MHEIYDNSSVFAHTPKLAADSLGTSNPASHILRTWWFGLVVSHAEHLG